MVVKQVMWYQLPCSELLSGVFGKYQNVDVTIDFFIESTNIFRNINTIVQILYNALIAINQRNTLANHIDV